MQFALTVPTVADRVAQMVVKQVIEDREARILELKRKWDGGQPNGNTSANCQFNSPVAREGITNIIKCASKSCVLAAVKTCTLCTKHIHFGGSRILLDCESHLGRMDQDLQCRSEAMAHRGAQCG